MISIIIPSFNKAQYIAETLNSLLSQTYNDWEALIIDDGSTDNSIEIIEEYCEKDQRFQLFKRERQPKSGSTCRNIGIEHAQGEYLVFLDADDLLTPTCLASRLSAMKLNPGFTLLIFSGGTFFRQPGDSSSLWIPPKRKDHLKMFLSHTLPWNISLSFWKTTFLKQLNGFDESYPRLQDVELHTRALMHPDVHYKIIGGEPDFYYRIDENRKLRAPYQFVENFIKAVELYISKMPDFIDQRVDKLRLLKALNGTYQAAYLTAQVQYDMGHISKDERNRLFESILEFHQPKGFFRVYFEGLKLGIHKVKGYNRVFKKILTGV